MTLDISLIRVVTALLRESHASNKAVTALFTSKATSPYKAVTFPRAHHRLIGEPLLH